MILNSLVYLKFAFTLKFNQINYMENWITDTSFCVGKNKRIEKRNGFKEMSLKSNLRGSANAREYYTFHFAINEIDYFYNYKQITNSSLNKSKVECNLFGNSPI